MKAKMSTNKNPYKKIFLKPYAMVLFILLLITGCAKSNDSNVSILNIETIPPVDTVNGVGNKPNTPTSESTVAPTPTATPVPEISIIMVGDILLHKPIENSCHLDDDSYDFSCIFSETYGEISKADLALVNEEVIIGGEELGVSGYPSFNAPYALADNLVAAGFDVILHATNHSLDKGKKGVINCLNYWDTNYPEIAVLGLHNSKEDQQTLYYYEQDGIKIAILNYTYGTNGIPLPEDMPYAVDLLDKDKIISDLTEAEQNADFTIVCPHWGTEYSLSYTKAQEQWTKLFVSNGADLIIGTHPHVIEPIEWYEDQDTNNRALVYYSIGNFINWTSGTGAGTSNRMVGGMAHITIGFDEANNVVIKDYGVTALVSHLENSPLGVTTYFLHDYSEEMASKNAIISQDSSFSNDYCINLCNEIWGDLWD